MNSLIFHNFLQCLLGSFYLYSLELNFVGIGFKIRFCNYSLNININVSHSIRLQLPHSIKIYILNKGTSLIFKSINKQLVGTIAACIKQLTATNKYTGKGIRYAYEILKLKERTKK